MLMRARQSFVWAAGRNRSGRRETQGCFNGPTLANSINASDECIAASLSQDFAEWKLAGYYRLARLI
jgi:hypothetical protein